MTRSTKGFGLALGFYVMGAGLLACGARAELFPPLPGERPDAPDASSPPAPDAGPLGTQPPPVDSGVGTPDDDAGGFDADGTFPNDPPPVGEDAGSTCTFDYDGAAPTVILGINAPSVQNVPAAVTPTGSTILIQQGDPNGSVCEEGLAVLIADETPPGSGIYSTSLLSLAPEMDPSFEENVTLSADGLTIIGLRGDLTAFVTTTRSAIGRTDFGPVSAGPFSQIVAPSTGAGTLWAPVLSPDGLAFYYSVHNELEGTSMGIYESIRTSTSAPFPPGTLMPALIQNVAQYVTAVTSDRLTIFLEESNVFGTTVMTRASLEDAFDYPAPMATLPGLRVRPIDGCAQLLGSCGSGCNNEKICTWPAP